ncbi:MAG: cardiolipin synthase [Comamonas sp.]|nr:cardiolipin synthase [Comamonas sp.]
MAFIQTLWHLGQQWLASGHFALALSIVWSAYLVLVGGWILLQRRAPAATIGWLLAMAVLPVVGLLVYFVFGPRRFRRQRLKRLRSRRRARMRRDGLGHLRDKATQAPPRLQQLVKLVSTSTQLPLSTAQRVELLVGGACTFDTIVQAIAQARHHVHLEYYIFEPDTTGRRVLQALTERAQAGVQVRLLVDALGSKRLARRHYQALLDAGGEVALFHPPRIGRRLRPVINFRTHRKIVVIDGIHGFTGGVNITDTEDKRLQANAYHDVHLRLLGRVVSWLQHVFLEDWAYALDYQHPHMPQDFAALLPEQDDGPYVAQIMASGPDSPLEAIHRVLVDASYAAHERLWLATPYFVPTEAAILALTSAALRGVDVRVLVPKRSDSRLVTAAARSYFDELLECGVKIYLYQGRVLHAKTMVVDDMLGMVGTANFDNRSFRLNYEVCALVYTPLFARQLAAQFSQDLAQAERVFELRGQSLPQRLGDAVARLFSPLL